MSQVQSMAVLQCCNVNPASCVGNAHCAHATNVSNQKPHATLKSRQAARCDTASPAELDMCIYAIDNTIKSSPLHCLIAGFVIIDDARSYEY